MSLDPTFDARTIGSDWALVAGELPAALADAIAAFEAADFAEPPAGVTIDTINARNAQDKITELAHALVLGENFAEAKRTVCYRLAVNVLAEAANAVPELIEKVEPEFDAAVAELQAAINALPPDHSATALIAAGPEAVAAYHRAVKAQATLLKFNGWINSMYGLPAFRGCRREPALLLTRPTTRAELKALLNAKAVAGSELNPVFIAAVNNGLVWELHTPAQAQALANEINSQPVAKSAGMRFVKW
jgi:hypothetical protein